MQQIDLRTVNHCYVVLYTSHRETFPQPVFKPVNRHFATLSQKSLGVCDSNTSNLTKELHICIDAACDEIYVDL